MTLVKRSFALLASAIAVLSLAACQTQDTGGNGGSSSSPKTLADVIYADFPMPNDLVTSPLNVTGNARGIWYFEASFPVRLLDGNGVEIAVTPAQAHGDWMTTDFVPFTATLTFDAPSTPTGTLVLEKDNPSGLPEHAAKVTVPVRFE